MKKRQSYLKTKDKTSAIYSKGFNAHEDVPLGYVARSHSMHLPAFHLERAWRRWYRLRGTDSTDARAASTKPAKTKPLLQVISWNGASGSLRALRIEYDTEVYTRPKCSRNQRQSGIAFHKQVLLPGILANMDFFKRVLGGPGNNDKGTYPLPCERFLIGPSCSSNNCNVPFSFFEGSCENGMV